MLPQLDGIQLCQRLRCQGYGTPILLLTARDQQTDKIEGLEAGADDYVVKPFDLQELLVRIRVLLRRTLADTVSVLSWGEICLDPVSCEVSYQGNLVSLTAKEYSILELFLRYSQQVFSVSTLLDRIWSSEEFPSEATVRSHIRGLRRKFKAVGAPTDLIETVHGLGYRLKSYSLERSQEKAPSGDKADRKRRYLDGLTQAWKAHKGEILERWTYLSHLIKSLKAQHQLTEQQHSQAQQITHSLAGTLGTFGLIEGHRLALQLEQLLSAEGPVLGVKIAQFQSLVTTLGHALDEPPSLASVTEDGTEPLRLLIVDVNAAPYIQQLMALAVAQGFETTVAASVETASQQLSLGRPHPSGGLPGDNLPNVVLINLVAGAADPILEGPILQALLRFITQLTQQLPQVPLLLITPQADFGNRLDLIRRGGTVVLEYPMAPTEILDVMTQALHASYRNSKIMIVDDDTHHLQQVIQQLQPWNFQITPLANPQRFWSLFTQVLPDLVILDIEMPHVSGFELCQVLRSHPQWQNLPIIFLSIHAEQEKQDQAFAIGADDYITKPIRDKDLGLRLVNRLKRYQAWVRAHDRVAYEGI